MKTTFIHIIAAVAAAGCAAGGVLTLRSLAAGFALFGFCGMVVMVCVTLAMGSTAGTLIDRTDGHPLALSDLVYLLHKCGMETPAATPLYVWQDRKYVPLRGLFAARIHGQRALILDSTQEEPHVLSN